MAQIITRKYEFDAGHRIVDHKSKCQHPHGHRYVVEMDFVCEAINKIGYTIDFGDIKRIAGHWIDEKMDHGFLVNPSDEALIELFIEENYKFYAMSLNADYCNPTAENIAREIYLALIVLFGDVKGLVPQSIRLYETPNCWVTCDYGGIPDEEKESFYSIRGQELHTFKPTTLQI